MEIEFVIPVNGRQHKAEVRVKENGRTVFEDLADLRSAPERDKLVNRIKGHFPDANDAEIKDKVNSGYFAAKDRHDKTQEAARQAGPDVPEGAVLGTMQLLDGAPLTVRRPLCLVG